ncbi:MAG: flagellar motor protein [Thermoleophilia bacterium]|jgi:chemotaxis protein MotA|nr:flagellar motor protein [Thermoleophilia bacterium]
MAVPVGFVIAFIGIFVGMILKGGTFAAIISIPAALMVAGGTFGACVASFSLNEVIGSIKAMFGVAFKERKERRPELIDSLVGFSEKARREGLLVLEDDAKNVDDEFLRKGVQLVVDGTDPELVRDILETEVEGMETRHRVYQDIYKNAGAFAPTVGILGTVLSLVSVLQHLDKPNTLGPSISAAFLATFYGVFSANIIFIPVQNALKKRTQQEAEERTLMIEGILSIQSGDNPRVLAQKLKSFLPPALRTGEDDEGGAARAGGDEREREREAA